ncbi:hypothetical protein AYL99_03083 [Fonsecaea erecta]|uniref:C2H2-type domain-containing protein n=1 Tax=Fonsecaea erecta TaxID=1367422 RepID=A0A178ZWS4_9EURO|nr:hypothetical protein AYL99_03083 [Fonsecaea erecta]OAP63856.1 hypothetical protein AYL99_03083 [Fonsecaea erecta]
MEPTQQDKAEQVDELAGNATRACFARFRSCIAALDGEHRTHLEVRFADLKLWADSVGALAHGKASLDWRLSGRLRDIFLVTSLLDMLEQFLEGYKTAAIEDGDEDEIEEAEQGIDEMMDNLAWIGSAIRRSGTKSRLQKADMSFERDRAGKDKRQCDQLRAHLICIMKSRPTESAKSKDYSKDFHSIELQGIQNRLVEANLRRWHRFRYAQRHSDVLRASRAVQNMPMHVIPEVTTPDSAAEPTNTPAPRINTANAKQRNEANDQGETRTTAGLSASAFGSEYQGLEGRYARPAKSTMTRISSITRFARFPKAKKSQTQRKILLCPCCCQALPLEEAEDPDLWAKHMKNDISPYTCIVENCPTPYRFYVTRNEWREHVLCDHPPKWRCSCCTGTRPVFQSLPSFMAHLDEKHESQVSDETFERITAKSTFRTFGITNCPLCNDHGPTDSPELIEHVLGHIYDFSMYALPWRTIPQTGLNKPIRTFNDIAPVLDPNDDEDATEMRMFSHTRILEWVEEPHPEEESLTPEQRATIRDLDWDDYQAMDNEDGADPIVADYFDRAEIDYFEDDASSRGASSQAGHSASTRQLSIASSSTYSSRTQANPPLSAQEMDSALAEATIADDDESVPDKESIEAMYIRALVGNEKALGPDHTSTLDTVNNLGRLYADQGKLAEAEKMYIRALVGNEKTLGPDHISTLDTVNNLGRLYADQGKLAEAEKMCIRALVGNEKTLGPDHISTLDTVSNLGRLYADQGKLAEAEKMYIRALAGNEKTLGPDHTSTLDTVSNLGRLYADQGKLAEAEKMYIRALVGNEKTLGPDYISTLDTVSNLGRLYADQGKLAEAEKMYIRALAGNEKALGADHPATLTSMNNLALVLQDQGKYEQAEEINRRALAMSEKMLGVDHPATLTSMSNLALVLQDQGKYEQAEEINRRALAMREKMLGVDHPATLTSMSNLALVLQDQGKYEQAEEINRRALAMREKMLGVDHPATLTSMSNLALVLQGQGKYEQAEEINRRALARREKMRNSM